MDKGCLSGKDVFLAKLPAGPGLVTVTDDIVFRYLAVSRKATSLFKHVHCFQLLLLPAICHVVQLPFKADAKKAIQYYFSVLLVINVAPAKNI